jgi:AAA ATPase domain
MPRVRPRCRTRGVTPWTVDCSAAAAWARLTIAMGELGNAARLEGGRPFVGRDREVAELAAALEDAVGGRGRLLLVTGEPGIGKTWLAAHVAERAPRRGVGVLWGRCWEGGGAPPFWPWAQIITTLAEGCDDQSLVRHLGAGASSIAQVVPGLSERLGTTTISPGPSLESDAARFYLFIAITELLKKAASARPLLLVLDDLHAADDASLLLLRFLARDLRAARLLVVGIYRDVEAARRPGIADAVADLVREGQLVSLRGLDRDAVRDLIERLSGAAPSEAKVAAMHEATDGNPLFIREAVRLLASQGTMEHPGWGGVPIPGSVRALIGRRLALLSADAVQVLSAAAVVGRELDLPLVTAAADLSAERVLDALSEAVVLGVVAEEPGAVERYRFSHSLVREVLYDRLPIPVRMQLHRRVGAAIERLHGAASPAHAAELARHFAEVAATGEAAKALAYARQAGEQAMGMCAYEEAAAEYRRALHALEFADPDQAVGCELLLRLGEAQARAGDYHSSKGTYLRAAQLSRRLGSPERLARAALGFGEPQAERGRVDQQLVGLLQEALDSLSPRDSPLRVRLLARLSTELTFSTELTLSRRAAAHRAAQPAGGRDGPARRRCRRPGHRAARTVAGVDGAGRAGRALGAGRRGAAARADHRRPRAGAARPRGSGGQLAGVGRHPGGRGRHRRPCPAGRGAPHAGPPVDGDDDAGDARAAGRLLR